MHRRENAIFIAAIFGFILISALVPFCASRCFAFNHPEIKWLSITTSHFNFHYYDKTEPLLYPAWKIAEEAYKQLERLYPHQAKEKIDIALADYNDYSNGFAAPLDGAIMIWAPDSFFELRGPSVWLRTVITHELTHILSLEKRSSIQWTNWDFGVTYASPGIVLSALQPLVTTAFFPHWFAEGVAQLGSQDCGSDCWDSRRDMILRSAVLADRQLSLAAMNNFTHDWLGNELVYNQGYSFAAFIRQVLGEKNFVEILNANRGYAFDGLNFDGFFRVKFKTSLQTLYQQWIDSLRTQYRKQEPQQPSAIALHWTKGTVNKAVRLSPDRSYWGWLTSDKNDVGATDLVICRRGSTAPVARIHDAREDWDFSRDGKSVYFIKSLDPDTNRSYFNDLFSYDFSTKTEHRLTTSGRIYSVSASPDGQWLLCVKYEKGLFSLQKYSFLDSSLTRLLDGASGQPFIRGVVCADSKTIVAEQIINGQQCLERFREGDTATVPLINANANVNCVDPSIAADGRIYFSADFNGIFNIYSVSAAGDDFTRHSDAATGLFSPVCFDSATVFVSAYTASGFTIASIAAGINGGSATIESNTAAPALPTDSLSLSGCKFQALPQPQGKVVVKPELYTPDYRRPRWSGLSLVEIEDNGSRLGSRLEGGDGDTSKPIVITLTNQAGIYQSDGLQKKQKEFSVGFLLKGYWNPKSPAASSKRTALTLDYNLHKSRYNEVSRQMMDHVSRPFIHYRPSRSLPEPFVAPPYSEKTAITTFHQFLQTPYSASGQASTDSTATEESELDVLPLFYPRVTLLNQEFAPTLFLNTGMLVYYTMIPILLSFEANSQWQLSRQWFCDLACISQLYLIYSIEYSSFFIPISLTWSHTGYVTDDIAVTNRGQRHLSVSTGVDIQGYDRYRVNASNGRKDTLRKIIPSVVSRADFSAGFA
ncbi:MAG: hypothetical protein JW795_07325, partial [Chitinivibrionales bacterium]|nr:hypothetical protein [Chitinivibrionales bacterium]